MHTTLYRKWRPADFESVVGQNQITDVLRHELSTGKVAHAYLFTGSRGTGKTTCAKILAKAVNCVSPSNGNPCGKCEFCRHIESGNDTDIIEFDAASNTGVDFIRQIREEIVYAPAFLRKKVYIIDEVHMLSTSAFNALLKTLEEPPEHAMFIFATTEVTKLPITIISRCQRFDFRRISAEDITGRLLHISEKEGIEISSDAARQIAVLAKGGMRDAISLLELCSGTGKYIDSSLINSVLGIPDRVVIGGIIKCILGKNISGLFRGVEMMHSSCPDISVFWQQLISYYRDMLVISVSKYDAAKTILELTDEEMQITSKTVSMFTREKLLYHMSLLEKSFAEIQNSGEIGRIIAEMTLIKMSDDKLSDDNSAILSRIAELERKGVSVKSVQQETNFQENTEHVCPVMNETENEAEKNENGMTEIYDWYDIVSDLIKEDPLQFSSLKKSEAFSDGKKLVINMSAFAAEYIGKNSGALESIALLAVENGFFEKLSKNDIVINVKTLVDDDDNLNEII